MSEVSGFIPSLALQALLAIVCVQAVTGAAVVSLGRRDVPLKSGLSYLVSAAAGVLLATACVDLLPDAVRDAHGGQSVWVYLLGGLLVLFCLETLAHHFSAHSHPANQVHIRDEAHEHHETLSQGQAQASVIPLLFGSALHSAVDGLAITAAFAAGPRPGWSAAAAVALHELPHRLGDLSLMLHRGLPPTRAALLAVASGAMAIAGALLVLLLPGHLGHGSWMLPVSAATFLYVALADLIPELHARSRTGQQWLEVGCLLGGAALMTLLTIALGD